MGTESLPEPGAFFLHNLLVKFLEERRGLREGLAGP
jgi:hypothetical protein